MLYLVGSRLFGTNVSEFSDYDYIGEYNQENLEYVASLGLKRVAKSKFHQFCGRHEGKLMDVILYENIVPRLQAREYLLSLPEIKTMPNSKRDELLKEVIRYYEERQYVGL